MSDKRLLSGYGTRKSCLNVTRSGSIRPSGLRITRAEVRTKELRFRKPGKSRKLVKFFQRLSHKAEKHQRLRFQNVQNQIKQILREILVWAWMTLRPGSISWLRYERTAGRYCCNRQNRKAMGCSVGFRPCPSTGHNNSNLRPTVTSVAQVSGN